jgi:hypothetical protein
MTTVEADGSARRFARHCFSRRPSPLRKLLQYRLRTLFVLVTVAALAALWWSHRLYCLERAKFHRAEIARCQEQQVIEAEKSLNEQIAVYVRARTEAAAELEKRVAEVSALKKKVRSALEGQRQRRVEGLLLDASRSQRWEDQSISDSMAQGFLIVPAPGGSILSRPGAIHDDPPPNTAGQYQGEPDVLAEPILSAAEPPKAGERAAEKELAEPDLVTPYEAKAAALSREVLLHTELAEKYLRAIYRPWMRVDESALSEPKGQ